MAKQINDGRHIDNVMSVQVCHKHQAQLGEPCYTIPSGTVASRVFIGVCNKRAVKAGANGEISESSKSRLVKPTPPKNSRPRA